MTKYQTKYSGILFFILGCSTLLAACGSNPVITIEPTVTAPIVTPTTVDEIGTSIPIVEAEEVDQCVLCHSDKQQLIDTAKPEEEVISENEGAG